MLLARLVQAGERVLIPFGENVRYDLVIDQDGSFIRVQCKTGRLKDGAVRFPTCSSTYHHPANRGISNCHQGYTGQADVFGVYCPDTGGTYIVPVEDCPERQGARSG